MRYFKEVVVFFYRKVVMKKFICGCLIEGMVFVVFYVVCRMEGILRMLDEIVLVFKVLKKEIGRSYCFMVRGLGLNFRLISLIEYVDCFGDVFGVSVRIKKRVKEILNEVIKCGIISGKGLMGFVVVVFYIVVFFEGEKKM